MEMVQNQIKNLVNNIQERRNNSSSAGETCCNEGNFTLSNHQTPIQAMTVNKIVIVSALKHSTNFDSILSHNQLKNVPIKMTSKIYYLHQNIPKTDCMTQKKVPSTQNFNRLARVQKKFLDKFTLKRTLIEPDASKTL